MFAIAHGKCIKIIVVMISHSSEWQRLKCLLKYFVNVCERNFYPVGALNRMFVLRNTHILHLHTHSQMVTPVRDLPVLYLEMQNLKWIVLHVFQDNYFFFNTIHRAFNLEIIVETFLQ
jgi:protein tyrosine phosphatase